MIINKTAAGDGTILELEGRLDTLTSPMLQKTILAELSQAQTVILDFMGLSYVSSAGLRALLIGQKSANEAGKALILTHICPEVMKVFQMTGFVSILEIQQ